MTYVSDSLAKMSGLSKSRRTFIALLLKTILATPGKMNFRNMSRYSEYCEKTYARHYARPFDFPAFNAHMLDGHMSEEAILAIDASFIPKSGKKTYGLDLFFDTCNRRSRRGLELSLIALVDTVSQQAYTLSARQTPAFPRAKTAPPKPQRRLQHYIEHLGDTLAHVSDQVRYVAADGAYARCDFIQAVRQNGRHVITRLRCDANLRYLYDGPQRRKNGRRKRYSEKVDLNDPSSMDFVEEIKPGIDLYTARVNGPHFACDFRIAYLLDRRTPGEVTYIVLASTDLSLSAQAIVTYYSLRFQVEFLFRDGKQHAGLRDCQARDQVKLDFHFNAALAALNLARLQWAEKEHKIFSMASIKRISFNELYLDCLNEQLGFEPEFIKRHPAYERVRSFGAIAA